MYSERLKSLRKRIGYNQATIANLLDIDRSQYGKYENEYTTIPIKHLNKVCNYFNVSLDYIFNPKFDSCYLKISRKARKNLVFYLFYN